MDIFEMVKEKYPVINNAAGEYLTKLTGADIAKDIKLSAEMAGLMMLRASPADLKTFTPGSALLGAVPDEAGHALNRFIFSMAMGHGLNAKDLDFKGIPADAKTYLPELTQFEGPFYEVCEKHSLEKQLFSFTAAASAIKLVLAGQQLKLLDGRLGLAMLLYHVVAGSKTVPYPFPSKAQGHSI